MNIFVLDRDVKTCAQYHQDKHVVKMILETAQMLCAAHALTRSGIETPYAATHARHPCTQWTWLSLTNYKWLCELGKELGAEYTYRYGKTHKSEAVIDWAIAHELPRPDLGLTKFAQAMPDEFKRKDTVEAYRAYYRATKAEFKRKLRSGGFTIDKAKWTNRPVPQWFLEQ